MSATAQVVRLAWTQQLDPPVTGFVVTVDGARSDYALSPLAEDGTCSCSIPLPFSNGHHSVAVVAYNSYGEAASQPLVIGPTAQAGGPYAAQPGTLVYVSASGSADATGTITTYLWNWGDGSPAVSRCHRG